MGDWLVRVAEEIGPGLLCAVRRPELVPLLPGVRWVRGVAAASERSSIAPRSVSLGTWQIGLSG
jgi:hypothetical protein